MINPRSVLTRGLEAVLVFAMASYATALACALWQFAWRQPMFDQYRLYKIYLTQPFPLNALQLENGHRPVFPALLRIFEIEIGGASQSWQIVVGAAFLFSTALLIAYTAMLQTQWPRLLRLVAAAVVAIAIFWMANARMQLHGNELVHTYLLTLCVVVAAMCLWLSRNGATRSMVFCALACFVATFSFGPGIATFVSMAVLGMALRIPLRRLWPLSVFFGFSIGIYLFVLPDNSQVRDMLHLAPLESAWNALKWLGSPWVNAWLGLGDPALVPSTADAVSKFSTGRLLVGSADILSRTVGSDGRYAIAGMLSLIAVLATAANLIRIHRTGLCTQTEVIGLALSLFGAGTAVIIGIGRLELLREAPLQVFADRYLVWPCFFWLGFALQMLPWLVAKTRPAYAAVAALALGLVLVPTQQAAQGWAAAVNRISQQSAAAAQSDFIDNDVFPDGADASRAAVLEVVSLFRSRHLAMFASELANQLGATWPRSTGAPEVRTSMNPSERMADARNGQPGLHFSGDIADARQCAQLDGKLVVIDSHDAIVGYAQISHLGRDRSPRWIETRTQRGFDGYVRDFRDTETYHLARLNGDTHQAEVIARILPP
jgi:hypothetical protein